MARTTFTAEVLTPEGEVFNDEVEMVSTRTTVGCRIFGGPAFAPALRRSRA